VIPSLEFEVKRWVKAGADAKSKNAWVSDLGLTVGLKLAQLEK